jgi:hypothetical protein
MRLFPFDPFLGSDARQQLHQKLIDLFGIKAP